MKRNILLLFGLIGVVFLDWSCVTSCDDDLEFDVKLSNVTLFAGKHKADSGFITLETGDSVRQEEFRIALSFEYQIVQKFASGNGIYANDCGAGPRFISTIDSICIYEIQGNQPLDVSSYFGIEDAYGNRTPYSENGSFVNELNQSLEYGSISTYLYLNSSYQHSAQKEYLVRMYSWQDVYDSQTDPVFIIH